MNPLLHRLSHHRQCLLQRFATGPHDIVIRREYLASLANPFLDHRRQRIGNRIAMPGNQVARNTDEEINQSDRRDGGGTHDAAKLS